MARRFKCKNCTERHDTEKIIIWWINRFCSKQCRLDFARSKTREATEKQKLKQKKIRDKKANSISVLGKKLDKVFSEYIRKRDAIATTGYLWEIVCITCNERKEYYQFDCWHFVSRANRSTRWEENNCNAQCKVCNNRWWGRQYEHWKAIDKKYWEWEADRLITKWQEVFKVTRGYLQDKIDDISDKLSSLDNNILK